MININTFFVYIFISFFKYSVKNLSLKTKFKLKIYLINNFLIIYKDLYFIKCKKIFIINILKNNFNKLISSSYANKNPLNTNFYSVKLKNFYEKTSRFICYKNYKNFIFIYFFTKTIKTSFTPLYPNNYKSNINNNFFLKIFKKWKNFNKIKNSELLLNFLLDSQNYNIFQTKYLKQQKKKYLLFKILYNYKHIINYNHYFNFFGKKLTFLYSFLNIIASQKYFNSYRFNFVKLPVKFKYFIKYLNLTNDFFYFNKIKENVNFISNKYLINYFNLFDVYKKNSSFYYFNLNSHNNTYNNYYPAVFLKKKPYELFFKNLKFNLNLNFLYLSNKIILNFLEFLVKKKLFLKISSNRFNKLNNFYLDSLLNDYKNFQPIYFKNYLFSDFLIILWYSFVLKDLKLISQWISKFMETLNFKNHKKFINFFQNFLIKYSSLFIDVLKVKGFFFDIRGKVGVTGSSKKRHICFKFGSINKSSKNLKINFNQNLVRTYSGVLGVTYIICF